MKKKKSKPRVAIIMGSDSDLPIMKDAGQALEQLEVSFEMSVVSAHRTPEEMSRFAKTARTKGIRVIIAGAGGAAHLPGMVAAHTELPVIGVPVPIGHMQGQDALFSIVQMPKGVPVATVAIGNAFNAGILAAQILGAGGVREDTRLLDRLGEYKQGLRKMVLSKKLALGLFLILGTALGPQARAESQEPVSAPSASPAGSGSHSMNPDISLDGLFALSQFNRSEPLVFSGGHDPHNSGFNIQQAELSLTSFVDPYFRADANFVIVPNETTGEVGVEIEELYATSLSLPANLQVKAGTFFTAFGRNNPTHPHTWDFANKPLVLGRFFGGDGLRNPGVQVSWLTPLPWYSELVVSAQNGSGSQALSFLGPPTASNRMRSAGDTVNLVRWGNFVELGESLSLNLGASVLDGPNVTNVATDPTSAFIGSYGRTRILGADVFLKFREVSTLSFISFQAELAKRYYNTPTQDFRDQGAYAQINYRLPGGWNRWHLGARYDLVGPKRAPVKTGVDYGRSEDPDTSRRYRVSPVVTFYPSEFSKIRLQYDYDRPSSFAHAQQVATLQFEFVVGAHGAHAF